MITEPENIPALIAMELHDARFHRARAIYWYAAARQVRVHAKAFYLTEGDEHLATAHRHLAVAIGWANR